MESSLFKRFNVHFFIFFKLYSFELLHCFIFITWYFIILTKNTLTTVQTTVLHYLILCWLKVILNKILLLFCLFLWLCQKNFIRWNLLFLSHENIILLFLILLIFSIKVLPLIYVNLLSIWSLTSCTHVHFNVHLLLKWRLIKIKSFLSIWKI